MGAFAYLLNSTLLQKAYRDRLQRIDESGPVRVTRRLGDMAFCRFIGEPDDVRFLKQFFGY